MRVSEDVAAAQRAKAMQNVEKQKWQDQLNDRQHRLAILQAKLPDKERSWQRYVQEEQLAMDQARQASREVEAARRLRQELHVRTNPYRGPGMYGYLSFC
jgi:chromosome segregation ATPase